MDEQLSNLTCIDLFRKSYEGYECYLNNSASDIKLPIQALCSFCIFNPCKLHGATMCWAIEYRVCKQQNFKWRTYLNKTITFAKSGHWIYRQLNKFHLSKRFEYLREKLKQGWKWIAYNWYSTNSYLFLRFGSHSDTNSAKVCQISILFLFGSYKSNFEYPHTDTVHIDKDIECPDSDTNYPISVCGRTNGYYPYHFQEVI
jgi:hypothetical protein